MAEEAQQQAVSEETAAEEAAPAAQDDLEAALKEFDAEDPLKASEETKPESETPDDIDKKVSERVQQELAKQRAGEKAEADLKKAVGVVKGDMDIDDGFVEFELRKAADSDPRLVKAFFARDQRPDEWNKVLKAFGRNLGKRFDGKIDSKVTADREAAAAAVQGASTAAPAKEELSQKEVANLSPQQFEQMKRDMRRGA